MPCNLVNITTCGGIVLQVSRATRKPDAHNRGLLSGLSGEQEPALLEGSAQQLTGEQAWLAVCDMTSGACLGADLRPP
jgi:hypothetical protein